MNDCCHIATQETSRPKRFDFIMFGALTIIILTLILNAFNLNIPGLALFAKTQIELLKAMSWGVALGLLSVGLMNKIPRTYFTAILGKGDTFADILKAAIAGVILDLCNHGILVISGKLYERGLSIAQVLTFLIASPWNSLSLTFILIALIGLKWTLVFTLASMVIAVISGMIYLALLKNGFLPANPHSEDVPEDFDIRADMKARLKGWRLSWKWAGEILRDGWKDGQMIIRWILFGAVVAAAMRAFIPAETFTHWFGPSLLGLGITMIAATIIEVCSEGSAPIATEIMNTGGAPGNGFAFLMAGVSTDYTEILVVREFTKIWKIALSLPLITMPQIIVLGLIFNTFT
ncbi:MAG: permease [Rhodospirillales bacterium]|nr:permease [Alphaproteobacteria bacterium]MCB9981778.1 permease [Rhodospirillales bacterium]